jgi:hypothetical protein
MGTSSRRTAPKSKNWTDAKKQATGLVTSGSNRYTPSTVMRSYIHALGGSAGLFGGGGGGGGGSLGGGSGKKISAGQTGKRSAISKATRPAQDIGSFFRDIADKGLDEALKTRKLNRLIGRPSSEVLAGILDDIGGNGASLPEAILRAAEAEVLGEIFDESLADYEELRNNLEKEMDGKYLINILESFLVAVIYKQWVSDLSDKLESGTLSADILSQKEIAVKDFIKGKLTFELTRVDPLKIDWSGEEGKTLIDDCLKAAIEFME